MQEQTRLSLIEKRACRKPPRENHSRGGSSYGKSGGEGKKDLLFLHGYLASGDSFAYQKGEFSKNFNVYAPDLKGFGKNADMEYPYSLGDYVRETKEYIQKNGLKNNKTLHHMHSPHPHMP